MFPSKVGNKGYSLSKKRSEGLIGYVLKDEYEKVIKGYTEEELENFKQIHKDNKGQRKTRFKEILDYVQSKVEPQPWVQGHRLDIAEAIIGYYISRGLNVPGKGYICSTTVSVWLYTTKIEDPLKHVAQEYLGYN